MHILYPPKILNDHCLKSKMHDIIWLELNKSVNPSKVSSNKTVQKQYIVILLFIHFTNEVLLFMIYYEIEFA